MAISQNTEAAFFGCFHHQVVPPGVPPAASEVPPGVPPAAIARHHLYIMLMASFIVDVIIIHYYEFL